MESGTRLLHGQQLAIPPQRIRSRLDQLARHLPPHRGVVVAHAKGSETLAADPERLSGVLFPAKMAGQSGHKTHHVPLDTSAGAGTPAGSALTLRMVTPDSHSR